MVFSRISDLKYFLFPFRVVGALADELLFILESIEILI
jgi:hypothetical protein